jgi:YD repeat-containing protein
MKIAILLVALGGLAALMVRLVIALARKPHDAIEYYRGWGGYRHPIGLQHQISKEEADALAAQGAVWLAADYRDDGRLMRVVKHYRKQAFFEYVYDYHPNGRLKSATVTREGRVTVLEYDARGRRTSEASIAF